jgi:hypothetical protein
MEKRIGRLGARRLNEMIKPWYTRVLKNKESSYA